MDPAALLDALAQPAAYPHRPERVTVRQTHISLVFLAGPYVYKVKKPVRFDFLDFSTLELRHRFCAEEVKLNRRLAPSVYLGVVPITRAGAGLRVEGEGEPVEWAVKMAALPEEATLAERLQRAEVDEETLRNLAARLAAFHAQAQTNAHIAEFGRWEVVAANARDNFTQSEPLVGQTVHPEVFARLRTLTEKQLTALGPLIRQRSEHGQTRDTHGDLRLDHVYLFPERAPPEDMLILDCIEFNEQFRFADPIADMAFLVMDLLYHGHRHLARLFTDAYLEAAGDEEGRPLVPFYVAYRAAVRAKVEGLKWLEQEVPPAEKDGSLRQARAHWLLALGALETADRRPCLVLVGGAPGSGKSTLARGLAQQAGFEVIRSDVVRKELAGVTITAPTPDAARQELYRSEWTERTYAACLSRARDLLFQGRRVLVDATFRTEQHRRLFLQTAQQEGVPGLFLKCTAPAELVRQRLHHRTGDASDADWHVYLHIVQSWEPAGPDFKGMTHEIETVGERSESLQRALAVLREVELAAGADRPMEHG